MNRLFCLTVAAILPLFAADTSKILTLVEGREAIRTLAESPLKPGSPGYVEQYDSIYLAMQLLRLRDEIPELEKRIATGTGRKDLAPWQLEAWNELLKKKRLSLELIQRAVSRLEPYRSKNSSDRKDRRSLLRLNISKFNDLSDVSDFLEEESTLFTTHPEGKTRERSPAPNAHGPKERSVTESAINPELLKTARRMQFDLTKGSPVDPQAIVELLEEMSEQELSESSLPEQNEFRKLRNDIVAGYHRFDPAHEYLGELERYAKEDRAEKRFLNRFLTTMKVDSSTPIKERVDLSHQFQKPELQCDSKSCMAQALVADMETHLGVPKLSVPLAYAYMTADERLKRQPLKAQLTEQLGKQFGETDPKRLAKILDIGIAGDDEEGIDGMQSAFMSLTKYPLAPQKSFDRHIGDFVPTNLNDIPDKSFLIGSFAGESLLAKRNQEYRFPVSALKRILSADKSMVVTIAKDSRLITEDWVRPESSGHYAHVINLVGYDHGLDPTDMVDKDYFIIRDSFTKVPMHYKMSAAELIPILMDIYKVHSVKKVHDMKFPEK